MKNSQSSVRGFSRDVLKKFSGMDRYVIGYAYNPGGYKPWPKASRTYYIRTIKRMEKQGWIEEAERHGKKFLKLTKKGKTQVLMCKLQDLKKSDSKKWDGKWRLAIFDIPEKGRRERDQIRAFLKTLNFYCLQKSVYIYPYGLPNDAVTYLRSSGLDRFIRFLRVDRMDNDEALKKVFEL